MSGAEQTLDVVLPDAIRRAATELAEKATELRPEKIRETLHMQPAFRHALTSLLGDAVVPHEPKLDFEHWHGIPERPGVGGIDIAVKRNHGDGYRAFIELKWGNPNPNLTQ